MVVPQVVPLVDEGLGNSAYVVDLGEGRALAVDASRDLRALRAATARHGLTVAFAADTHLHADFLSGALDLAASDGATILASAAGGREFPHAGLADGDEVDLGGLRLRALVTPGHTDEHLAFLLLDGDEPVGVFSGGSLIVGAAARTDLVDPDRIEELARAQYKSVQRLLTLPDDVALWPTHGAGSFCAAPPGAERTSSIGAERATNPLLRADDEDAFVAALVGSLGSFPAYFARLGDQNRRGPALLDPALHLPQVNPDEAHQLLDRGAVVVDVRPFEAFAVAHLTGSLSIPLREAFGTWLGWIAPPDGRRCSWSATTTKTPTRSRGRPRRSATTTSSASWSVASPPGPRPDSASRALDSSTPATSPGSSFSTSGKARSSTPVTFPPPAHVELGELPARADQVPTGATVVMCGHGERAMTAASLLERGGRKGMAVLVGGPEDWADAHDTALHSEINMNAASDVTTGRDGATPAARPAGQRRPVHAAGRGQRPRRRDARPRAHRAAAARGAHVPPHRVHRGAHVHPRVRRREGHHQLPGRHMVRPVRKKAGAGRGLAGGRARSRCC